MIFLKLLNQSPLEVHTPTQSYHPAILVTGTSVGIGRDTALTLAKQGYTVFATVRRKEDAEDLSNEFEQHDNVMNGRLITLMMDVTSKEDIQKAYDSVCSTIGNDIPFVGLVNNAALILYMPLELASEKTYEESFNTNYFSVINLTKKFLPLLRRGKGRVVNLGSMAAWSPAPTTGVYSSTKAAIRAITQVWRMETRCMGVHFSLVEAGAVATRFTENQMATFRNFTSFPSNSKYYELSHNITSNVKESYENLFRMVALRSSLFSRSIPPAVVTDAIIHALTHQYPKNTYYVGLDARLVAAANWLFGDRVAEAIQGKALAVPNCPSDMISVM